MKISFLLRAAVLSGLCLAGTARAQGIPVIDIRAIFESVLQAQDLVQQIDNQLTQIEQMRTQLTAISGSRGLGAILNNPLIQNYLPPEAATIVNTIDTTGSGGMSATARALRSVHQIYNCENLAGTQQVECQAALDQPYQSMAFMQGAITTSNGRLAQIQSLMDQVNQTTDPKGVAEIQARIDAENALLGHVQSQMTMATGMTIAQDQVARSRADEARMQQAARTGNLADYLPPN